MDFRAKHSAKLPPISRNTPRRPCVPSTTNSAPKRTAHRRRHCAMVSFGVAGRRTSASHWTPKAAASRCALSSRECAWARCDVKNSTGRFGIPVPMPISKGRGTSITCATQTLDPRRLARRSPSESACLDASPLSSAMRILLYIACVTKRRSDQPPISLRGSSTRP